VKMVWNIALRCSGKRKLLRSRLVTSFKPGLPRPCDLSGGEVEPPFRIPVNPDFDDRTQHEVDGLLFCEWSGFLIELKIERVDFTPIASCICYPN